MVQRTPAARRAQLPTVEHFGTIDVSTLFHQTTTLLNDLAEKVAAHRSTTNHFDHAEATLELLPLATDEYTVARHRLHNAVHYQHEGEFGAAKFELRLMARSLNRCRYDTD